MKNSKVIIYDGSFNGFLTVLYNAFDKGWNVAEIAKQDAHKDELFTNNEYIKTDISLAKKVWFGLERKSKAATKIVEKEKRRMEVFASFQLSESDTSKALLKPKYNVLPLLSRHLRQALRAKEWEVFDTKRNYGISYESGKLEISSGNANVRQAV